MNQFYFSSVLIVWLKAIVMLFGTNLKIKYHYVPHFHSFVIFSYTLYKGEDVLSCQTYI